MFIVYFLVILLAGSSDVSAAATDSNRITWRGLSLETGFVLDWSPYPYHEATYRQEILSYHGLKTIHQFSGSENQTLCSPAQDVTLVCDIFDDLCFNLGFTAIAGKRIDVYSYAWDNPDNPCDNVGIDSGCELAFIRREAFLLYHFGMEFYLGFGLSMKWQFIRANLELVQGRETYGTEDPEVAKSIYQEHIWGFDLVLRWTKPNQQSGLRWFIEAGMGSVHEIGFGDFQLTKGNRFFLALKVNGLFWQF